MTAVDAHWEGYRRATVLSRLAKPLLFVAAGAFAALLALPSEDSGSFSVEADPPPQPAAVPVAQDDGQPGTWARVDGGPLTSRQGAQAVWAGSRAVIWSGRVPHSGTMHADGATYDPRRDRWEMLPPAPVDGRIGSAMAWTGDEVLVWGGRDASGALDDGAAYDVGSRTWRRLPPAPLSARVGAHGIWAGEAFVVWGGRKADGSPLSDGARYDPGTDRWRRLPPGPLGGRGDHDAAAVAVHDGVLVWSASGDGAATAIYDVARDRWRRTPSPRLQGGRPPVFAGLGGGVVVWGTASNADLPRAQRMTTYPAWWSDLPRPPVEPGAGRRLVGDGTVAVSWWPGGRALVLDLVAKTWTEIGLPPVDHVSDDAPVQLWAGDRYLLWHGDMRPGDTNRAGTWTPAGRWRRLVTGPAPLGEGTSAVWSGWYGSEQQLLVWGGARGDVIAQGAGYHPDLALWETTPDAPITGRHRHAAAWTGDRLLVVGGFDRVDRPDGTPVRPARRDGAAYDPATRTWRKIVPVPFPVTSEAATFSGRLLYVAAQRGGRTQVAAYDPAEDTWTPLPAPPIDPGATVPTLMWSGTRLWVFGADHNSLGRGATWDSRRRTWEPLPRLDGMWGPLAVSWADRRMVAVDAQGRTASLGRAWTDGWLPHDDAPVRGEDLTLAWTAGGLMAFSPVSGTAALLDPRGLGWAAVQAPPVRGRSATLVWNGRHLFALAGGEVAVMRP